jgi:Na+/H+ antiporter NhaD/arsenite permease-like protein
VEFAFQYLYAYSFILGSNKTIIGDIQNMVVKHILSKENIIIEIDKFIRIKTFSL